MAILMTIRPFNRPRLVWLLTLTLLSFFGSVAAAERRPNFLVILGDNVGKDWMACYGADRKETPNIDRLAAGGVRFKTFYVTPLCSTTRVALLTGRYGFSTGWHTHHDSAFYGGGGLDWRRETTWARALQTAGYATAIAGKWQINDLYAERDALKQHGFEQHLVWTGALTGSGSAEERYRAFGSNPIVPENRYWDPVVFHDGQRQQLQGKFSPDVFADYLVEFMERNCERPFVAYYSSTLTHTPPVPTPSQPDKNAAERELFAGMVRHLDAKVGQFVAALDRLGLRNDTFIIFMTDNATTARYAGTIGGRPWPGVHNLSEAGLDMPLIVNAPGRIAAGRVSSVLVDCTDIFPTMVELAGGRMPPGSFDGRSFAGELLGRGTAFRPRDWIFSMYDATRVVRDQQFKLYSTGELYDVAIDPLEKTDLATSAQPGIVAARQRLGAVLASLPESATLPFKFRSGSARRMEASRLKKAQANPGGQK